MSPSEVLEHQLIENLLREDLKAVEEARVYAALMELNGWTGKQVAERLRVPASQVSRALALLRLPDDIRQRVDSGEIAARAGYELSKLENADHQRQLADRAADGNLTHEETARLVRQHRGKRRRQHRVSPCHTKLCFPTEQGWEVIVTARRKGTYDEIEQALEEALAEVRHRVLCNQRILQQRVPSVQIQNPELLVGQPPKPLLQVLRRRRRALQLQVSAFGRHCHPPGHLHRRQQLRRLGALQPLHVSPFNMGFSVR